VAKVEGQGGRLPPWPAPAGDRRGGLPSRRRAATIHASPRPLSTAKACTTMGLAESLQLFERYSVVILPVLVIAEQVGVPLPAVPALLAVGALAASGRASIPLVLGAIAVVALT